MCSDEKQQRQQQQHNSFHSLIMHLFLLASLFFCPPILKFLVCLHLHSYFCLSGLLYLPYFPSCLARGKNRGRGLLSCMPIRKKKKKRTKIAKKIENARSFAAEKKYQKQLRQRREREPSLPERAQKQNKKKRIITKIITNKIQNNHFSPQ